MTAPPSPYLEVIPHYFDFRIFAVLLLYSPVCGDQVIPLPPDLFNGKGKAPETQFLLHLPVHHSTGVYQEEPLESLADEFDQQKGGRVVEVCLICKHQVIRG